MTSRNSRIHLAQPPWGHIRLSRIFPDAIDSVRLWVWVIGPILLDPRSLISWLSWISWISCRGSLVHGWRERNRGFNPVYLLILEKILGKYWKKIPRFQYPTEWESLIRVHANARAKIWSTMESKDLIALPMRDPRSPRVAKPMWCSCSDRQIMELWSGLHYLCSMRLL